MTNLAPKLQIHAYIKYFFLLSSLVLTVYVLILAKPIFNPLLAAFIVALILKPLSSNIERLKIPRSLSTLFSIILMLLVMAGLSIFFSSQVGNISSEMDSIGQRLNLVIDKLQSWGENQLGIAPQQQILYLKNSLGSILKSSTSFLTGTISATAGFFTAIFRPSCGYTHHYSLHWDHHRLLITNIIYYRDQRFMVVSIRSHHDIC